MRLKHRIAHLEVRHRLPAVYPVYALFTEGGAVERLVMSDASRLAGRDAVEKYRRLPRSFPLKVYAGFDPEIPWKPPDTQKANNEPQEPA